MAGAGGVVKEIGSFCTDTSVSISVAAFIQVAGLSQEIQDQYDFFITSHELGHRSDSLFSTGISIITPTSSSDSKSSHSDCSSELSWMPCLSIVLWELFQDHVTWHKSSFLFESVSLQSTINSPVLVVVTILLLTPWLHIRYRMETTNLSSAPAQWMP